MNVSEKPVIPSLTGVRFLAAFFVFLFHYQPFPQGSFMRGLSNEMYTGVGIFFVLSGFLICYNYFDQSTLRASFFKPYFVKRFARIYPVYFILTTLFFLYHYFRRHGEDLLLSYFLNISLLKGFTEEYMFTGLFQAWSLTVEECFYAAAPFVFWLYKKRNIFFPQTLVLVGAGILLVLFFQRFPFMGFFRNFHFLFMTTFFGRCFEFFVGMYLALLLKRGRLNVKIGQQPYLTFAGTLSVFVSLVVMSGIRRHSGVMHATDHAVGLLFNNVFFPVAVGVFFAGLIKEKTILSRFFASPVMLWLGKSSYVFYLIHAGLFADALYRFTGNNVWIKFIMLQFVAILVYWFVERPANLKLRALFLRKKTPGFSYASR